MLRRGIRCEADPVLEFDLLRQVQRVFGLDAQVAHGTLEFGVPLVQTAEKEFEVRIELGEGAVSEVVLEQVIQSVKNGFFRRTTCRMWRSEKAKVRLN